MKSKTYNFQFCLTLLLAFSMVSFAQGPTTITDNTMGTAAKDGTINVGEYVGSSIGINSGFGNVIGSNSSLHIDSDNTGNLSIGLTSGGDLNNAAIIYIDVDGADGGGFNSTSGFTDNTDGLRAGISGNGTTSGTSDLTFADGFNADYAIAFDAGFAGLWELVNGGSHTFIVDLGITPSGSSTFGAWEIDGFTMTNIGLSAGASFNYVVTYLNTADAFRSDEFHGVAQSTRPMADGNIGVASFSLAAGDFNTFHSFDPTSNTTIITDNAATIATNDGTVNGGEYAGSSTACGDGFGGILGATTLHFDSDVAGNLALALDGGSALSDPNVIVIYIDTDGTAAGVTSTSTLTDTGDPGRAAISGNGTTSDNSDLTFPNDFNPDYAISIQNGSQNLFQLSPTNNLTFVANLTQNISGTTREFSDISMTNLGLVAGDSFNYIATLLNSTNAFRSDEFQGVTYCPVANIGSSSYSLENGEFNTFQSFVPPPPVPTLSQWGLTILALLFMTFGTLYIREIKIKAI